MAAQQRHKWLLPLLLFATGVEGKDCRLQGKEFYAAHVPPTAVHRMSNADHCQTACMANPFCNVWSYLHDTSTCWQLPKGYDTQSIDNEHGVSGTRLCQLGVNATVVAVAAAPAAPDVRADAAVKSLIPKVDMTALQKATPRPYCATQGKAFNDTEISSPNGGFLPDADACQLACMALPFCRQFSFFVDTKACWLQAKNAQVTEYSLEAAISGPKSCELEATERSMQVTFKTFDTDANSYLNSEEAQAAVKHMLSSELHMKPNQAEIDNVWAEMDSSTGGDGKVSLDDFETFTWRRIAQEKAVADSRLEAVEAAKAQKPECSNVGLAYHDSKVVFANGAFVANAKDCQLSCNLNPFCAFFTFYANSKACWMQGGGQESSIFPSTAAISGPSSCSEKVQKAKEDSLKPKPVVKVDIAALMVNESKPDCAQKGKAYNDPSVTYPNGAFVHDSHTCQRTCSSIHWCKVFTYYVDSNACWLQTGNATEIASEAAISGPKACEAASASREVVLAAEAPKSPPVNLTALMASTSRPACASQGKAYHDPNVTYPNGAYLANADNCQTSCHSHPKCKLFTYYVNSKACWLLGEDATEFVSEAAISGPAACAAPREVVLGAEAPKPPPINLTALMASTSRPACASQGKAYHDPNVTYPNGAYLANADNCQTSCLSHPKCKLFTYYVNSKACWLLGEDATEFISEAAISGPAACAAPKFLSWTGLSLDELVLPVGYTKLDDGSIKFPDGKIMMPDIKLKMPDGQIIVADADGQIELPNGAGFLQPDFSIKAPKVTMLEVPSIAPIIVTVATLPPPNLTALMASTSRPPCSSQGKGYHDPAVTYPNGAYLANADHCQIACSLKVNCSVFTYYVDSKACWLQGKDATEITSEAAISGPKACKSTQPQPVAVVPPPTLPPVDVPWVVRNTNRPDCSKVGMAYHDPNVTYPNGAYVTNAMTCQLTCVTHPKCKVFTWYANSKACWLLGAHATEFTSEDAISGPNACVVASAAPTLKAIAPTRPPANLTALMASTSRPSCASQGRAYTDPNVTYPNGAYVANADHCQTSCLLHANCKVFTYYVDSKACWLQGENAEEFVSEAAISGPKACADSKAATLEAAAIVPIKVTVPTLAPPNLTALMASTSRPSCSSQGKGYDDPAVTYPNGAYLANADHCQMSCSLHPKCKVFTYYVDSKACWLQGENATEITSEAAISGPKACKATLKEAAATAAAAAAVAPLPVAKVPTVPPVDVAWVLENTNRPDCSHVGTAYNDPSVTYPNGAYVHDAFTCQMSCLGHLSCKVFTWYADSKACWLLGSNSTKFASQVAVSGPKACEVAPSAPVLAAAPVAVAAPVAAPSVPVAVAATVAVAAPVAVAARSVPVAVPTPVAEPALGASPPDASASVSPPPDFDIVPFSMVNLSAFMQWTPKPSCAKPGVAFHDAYVKLPIYLADSTHCQAACRANVFCKRFTYYVDTNACWQQSDNTTSFKSETAISGPEACGKEAVAATERDVAAGAASGASAAPAAPIATASAASAAPAAAIPKNWTKALAKLAKPKCSSVGKAYHDANVTYPTGAYLASASDCQVSCMANPSCETFTYYANTKACWLQGKTVSEFASPVAISGPKSCLEAKIDAGIRKGFDAHDLDKSGSLNAEEAKAAIRDMLKAELEVEAEEDAVNKAWEKMKAAASGDDDIRVEDFQTYMWQTIADEKKTLKLKAAAKAAEEVARPACARVGIAYDDPSVKLPHSLVGDAKLCQKLCSEDKSCEKFTYFADSKACWFATGSSSTYDLVSAVSGSKDCADSQPRTMTDSGVEDALQFKYEVSNSNHSPGNAGISWLSLGFVTVSIAGFAYVGLHSFQAVTGSRTICAGRETAGSFSRPPVFDDEDLVGLAAMEAADGAEGLGQALMEPAIPPRQQYKALVSRGTI